MILQEQILFERARKVLGVTSENRENEIKYAYYRRMFQFHPDRNPDNPQAHEMTALINEAFGLLMGRRREVLLLKQDSLVATVAESAVNELEGVLSYEQWIMKQFYNEDEKSIWAY